MKIFSLKHLGKIQMLLMMAVCLLSGCGESIDDGLAEAVDFSKTQVRNDIRYLRNSEEPYTGWAKLTRDGTEQASLLSRYKDGKRDGPFIEWHETGQKKWEWTYTNSEPHDGTFIVWHTNEKKAEEGTYKDGEMEGLLTEWYENGQKRIESTYKNDERDGPFTEWHRNGQKESERTYRDGKADGLSTGWHENGQKWWKNTYKDGELVSE